MALASPTVIPRAVNSDCWLVRVFVFSLKKGVSGSFVGLNCTLGLTRAFKRARAPALRRHGIPVWAPQVYSGGFVYYA